MIELSAETAFTLYLLFCIFCVFAVWGFGHFKKREKKLEVLKDVLVVCEFCQCPYMAGVAVAVSTCPECGLFNKKL
jgi:hypothetical protein